jgi:hypothetical protein
LIVDPDLCAPVTATFAMGDATVAKAPDSAPLDLRHPSFDFTVSALAAGTTSLGVTVQRPTDAAPATGKLPIEVRADANPPACTPKTDDAGPTSLSASTTTMSGANALASASLSVPAGAFSRTDEWALPTFDASIACAADGSGNALDLTKGAAGSPAALGPAVTFDAPGNPSWKTKSLRRELDFAIPVNPAAMPQQARMRHMLVLYQGPRAKTPRAITIANPHFDHLASGDWVLRFESPWFGTYQAAVSPAAGTVSVKRHLTHRAVLGISMGGGGAALFGFNHHDQFDVIAPLGGNSDLTWLVWYFETYKFGGFCPVANPGCQTYAPNLYPLDETLAHTEDFDHWFFQPGQGTGGTFARNDWTQILEDFLIAGGNPNGQNADPAIPFMVVGPKSTDPFVRGVGVTNPDPAHPGPVDCSITVDPISPNGHDSAAMQAQETTEEGYQQTIQSACLASRCDPKNTWAAKTGFYDAAYNPDGSRPVISFCDGGQNGTSPYVDTWAPSGPGNQTPSDMSLAVDLNGNGIRDLGEPVIRQGEEPYTDTGTDGLADKDEPGYDAVSNPDPNEDDYDFQLNPGGTENDHVWEKGEPFQDVGLDGVPGTPQQSSGGYDVGEGDGQFTMSTGAQHLVSIDPHAMLHGRATPAAGVLDGAALSRLALWADGGVRDMANFGAVANHLIGAVASVRKADGTQVKPSAYYNNFENLPGVDPTQPDQYLASNVLWADVAAASHLRYGYIDATPQMIANGDGQHVGTGSQILYRLVTGFYFANASWPDADRTLPDSLDASDAPDAGGNAAPSSINELCAGKAPTDC